MLEETIGRWFDEATLKGVNQGMQKGMHHGLARALALQVQLRFGSVPEWATARLQDANEEQLLDWTGRILTAVSVQELFDYGANVA